MTGTATLECCWQAVLLRCHRASQENCVTGTQLRQRLPPIDTANVQSQNRLMSETSVRADLCNARQQAMMWQPSVSDKRANVHMSTSKWAGS